MSVQCSCFQRCRHLGRMLFMIRLHTASAGFQRSYFHAFSYIHPSGSLRSKNTFMPGKAQDMNIHLLHIDRVYPRRLRSVHNKKKPMLFRNLSDSLDIYHISCKIRSMCTDNSFRVLTDLVFYLFIRNISFTVAFHNAQFAPTLFHLIQWTQDGLSDSVELLVNTICFGFSAPKKSASNSLVS